MTDLASLYRIAKEERIAVDCFHLSAREAFSYMDPEGDCFIAIDPLRLRSEQEEREKLAHELGHCVTGSFYNQWAACDIRQKHENRADKWAIQKLIPQEELDKAVEAGCTQVWELAEYFNVTEDFMKKAICLYTYGNLNTEMYFDE